MSNPSHLAESTGADNFFVRWVTHTQHKIFAGTRADELRVLRKAVHSYLNGVSIRMLARGVAAKAVVLDDLVWPTPF